MFALAGLALVRLVLRLGDDAAVDTTPVLCKTALSEMALLEKNSSGVGEGSVEGGAGRFGMSRGAGVHPSRWSQLLCVHEICVES